MPKKIYCKQKRKERNSVIGERVADIELEPRETIFQRFHEVVIYQRKGKKSATEIDYHIVVGEWGLNEFPNGRCKCQR